MDTSTDNGRLTGFAEAIVLLDHFEVIISVNDAAGDLLHIHPQTAPGKKLEHICRFTPGNGHSGFSGHQLPASITRPGPGPGRPIVAGLLGTGDRPVKWLSVSSRILAHPAPAVAQLSFFDVSFIVEAQMRAAEKNRSLELLISSINDIIFELTPDGMVLELWTNAPERLFFPAEVMKGKRLTELFEPGLAARFLKIIRSAHADQAAYDMEYKSPLESHKDSWYQLQVKPVIGAKERVVAIISDITSQHSLRERMQELDLRWKFAQEKIKIDEQKFNQAFRYSGIGMALVDLDGRFLDVNKTLSQILGYTAREFKGMRFHDCTHPEDLSNDLMKLEQLNRREIDSYSMEKRYLHKHGDFVWCLLTVTVVYSTDKSPAFYISQIQDISVQKNQLEQLARQKEALEATTSELSMKLEKLEEFNYIVAHNLRGPASNIRSLVSLTTNAETDSERTEYLNMLKRSSDGLTETFRELADVLEASSNMPLTYERCNFGELTAKILKQFTADIAARSIVIEQDFTAENIHYPKIYLESIIYNLLSNAIKYSAPETVPEIRLKTEFMGEDILLTVSDNGIGIDMERYGSQLFQFRKTFHRGFDSRGIGLFLIRHQIERAGGSITASSAPGKGTKFIAFLKNP